MEEFKPINIYHFRYVYKKKGLNDEEIEKLYEEKNRLKKEKYDKGLSKEEYRKNYFKEYMEKNKKDPEFVERKKAIYQKWYEKNKDNPEFREKRKKNMLEYAKRLVQLNSNPT